MRTTYLIILSFCFSAFLQAQALDLEGPAIIKSAETVPGLTLKSLEGYGSSVELHNEAFAGNKWRLVSWTDGTFRIVNNTGAVFSPLVIEPLDGKVGIGTATPDMQLNVHTSSGISYIRVSDNSSGPTSGLRMGMSGGGNAFIINDATGKHLTLGTNGTSRVRINDMGYLGINDLSPDQLVHIKQVNDHRALRIEHISTGDYWENGIGNTTHNYKFYYNNLFRADISSLDGAYTPSSDRRLKKNINYMDEVLTKVLQLQPAHFQFLDGEDSDPYTIGFIAQDVEQVFPELVREMESGYKGLVYDGFAVISIKAIQELVETMKMMQIELDEMKRALQEL